MRCALWPDAGEVDLRSELGDYLGPPDDGPQVGAVRSELMALVAERSDGRLCGFIELSLRNIVDGCTSSPVGYIEGWFVDPEIRHQGIGRALVHAGELWARERGCSEMGSDAELENVGSQRAHRALGYEVTGKVVTFRRALK